jgi:hypothetical protein
MTRVDIEACYRRCQFEWGYKGYSDDPLVRALLSFPLERYTNHRTWLARFYRGREIAVASATWSTNALWFPQE